MGKDEIEDGVRHARLALEIVNALATDLLLQGGKLKPVTKSRLIEAMRDYQAESFSPVRSLDRLRDALNNTSVLEREDKRERPR